MFYDIRFAKDKIILTNVYVTKYSIPDVDAFTIAFYGICWKRFFSAVPDDVFVV